MYFPDHISHRAQELIGWCTIFPPLAILAVILRFLSRRLSRAIGPDDWTILAGLFLFFGLYTTTMVWAATGTIGTPTKELSTTQVEHSLRTFYVVEFFYTFVCPTVKMSFLLLYRRIFPTRAIRIATIVVGLIIIGWGVGVFFVVVFECKPVGSYWKPMEQEYCVNDQNFFYGNGISNLLTDSIILCLPMPTIWSLQLSLRRKVALTSLFALGVFTCVSSILRVTSIGKVDNEDILYTITSTMIWTNVEVGLGIVCACMPTTPHLFTIWYRSYKSTHGSSRGRVRGSSRKEPPSDATANSPNLSLKGLLGIGGKSSSSGAATEGSGNGEKSTYAALDEETGLGLPAQGNTPASQVTPPERLYIRDLLMGTHGQARGGAAMEPVTIRKDVAVYKEPASGQK